MESPTVKRTTFPCLLSSAKVAIRPSPRVTFQPSTDSGIPIVSSAGTAICCSRAGRSSFTRVCPTVRSITMPREVHSALDATSRLLVVASLRCSKSFTRNTLSALIA